ncbi:hypothetical protein B0H21DRAFT_777741 [Amylocystis lapponica]|nr:hypothetical protein B0H21DRAFT_777741 [Amylocystis lapponica]
MADVSHIDPLANAAFSDPSLTENRICPGCKKSVVNENGGVVVAFGQSFFHVDCFRCAKCGNQVTADTNLLLLSDGSPICANCSYSCNVCHLPILDEAIMTGDDSYHAHCFKCKVCKNRIDELVFAKTSQGIYCMNCHNQRVARSRRHAQRQREKEEEKKRQLEQLTGHDAASVTSSANSKEDIRQDQDGQSNSLGLAASPMPSIAATLGSLSVSRESSTPPLSRSPAPSLRYSNSALPTPPIEGDEHMRSVSSPVPTSDNLAVPAKQLHTRKSFDDSARALNTSLRSSTSVNSLNVGSSTSNGGSTGLEAPNGDVSRRDKRRSINPAIALTYTHSLPPAGTPTTAHTPSFFSPQQVSSPPSYAADATLSSPRPRTASSVRSSPDTHHTVPHISENAHSSPTPSRASKSSDDRSRSSTSPSVRQTPATRPSTVGSSSCMRPESGNRTVEQHRVMEDRPPALPPKEKQSRQPTRPPLLRLDTADISDISSEAGHVSSEEGVSPESSPVERTSHATLLHLRYLPSASRWAVDGNVLKLEQLAEVTEDGGLKLDMTSAADAGHASDRRRAVTDYAPRSPTARSQRQDTRPSLDARPRPRIASNALGNQDRAHITVTPPDVSTTKTLRVDKEDRVRRQLQAAVVDAATNREAQVVLPSDLAEGILELLEQRMEEYNVLKHRLDGAKRASKQYIDGLTVAQTEYDRELKARRDAEAEVTRLRVLLSGQAVRLSAISGDSKRQEAQRQLSREMTDSLSTLERSLSKLKVERDMTLAEVEQLSASRSSTTIVGGEEDAASIAGSLSTRFNKIKNQYQHELLPLTEQREALMREITELKASRDAFLEETTMLNARNEELAQLHAQYVRRVEAPGMDSQRENGRQEHDLQNRTNHSLGRQGTLSSSHTSTTAAYTDDSAESKFVKVIKSDITRPDMMDTHGPFRPAKFIKWPGSKTPKDNVVAAWPDANKQPQGRKDHVFQQVSVLRVARCDHCGDKMWGSQYRCTSCNIAVHIRCVHHVNSSCVQQTMHKRDEPPLPMAALPPSMFGRKLGEQIQADSPLDYEGIYRKSGGSGQSKTITQLFERGDYQTFDLRDTERFNDICSVTSVLKTYFRSLPDPLLTYTLHDKFIAAANIRDLAARSEAMTELVNELPTEHYHTTRALMMHLHRISQNSGKNLMHARNLGVVFGPTLMRSRDPNAEFTDMAGKALSVEWLVANAPVVFEGPASHLRASL